MWTRWRWAFWIIALPGLLVFWVAAAAYVGWRGPRPDNAAERQHAESYLDAVQGLALSTENLVSADRAGAAHDLLAQKTHILINQTMRWLDALKKRQVRRTDGTAQRAPLFSAALQFARRLHEFQRLIEESESMPGLLEDRQEKHLDAVRILLYNLVTRGWPWPALYDPASLMRHAWTRQLSDVKASARRLLARARDYQQLQVALGRPDNRLALAAMVFCAVIFWAALSLLAIKVLAPLFGAAPAKRGKPHLSRDIKKRRKRTDKTF